MRCFQGTASISARACDTNVEIKANEILLVVENTPVLAGVCGTGRFVHFPNRCCRLEIWSYLKKKSLRAIYFKHILRFDVDVGANGGSEGYTADS